MEFLQTSTIKLKGDVGMEALKTKSKISDFIEERQITSLYHFTKADNLHGILKNGLLSRRNLDENRISYLYNDEVRLEDKFEANCLSISFPNYRMFFKYRNQSIGHEWCVIEFNPRILYEKECLFCIENAASYSETMRSDEEKRGIEGLKKLYYNEDYRIETNLNYNYTTNPQAEVLVLDNIGVEYIEAIYFRENPVSFPFCDYKEYKFLVWQYLFDARSDYSYWR